MTTVTVTSTLALCLLATGLVPGVLRAQDSPPQAGIVVHVATGVERARGVVRGPDGAPLPGAEVWFDGDSLHRLTADHRGEFPWPALRAGVHLVAVRAQGHHPLLAPVHLADGRRRRAEVLLLPAVPDSVVDTLRVERRPPERPAPRP